MSFVAIELETERILVVSARPTKRGGEIENAFEIAIGTDDDAAAAERLKSALSKHGLSRSDAVVVVSRSSVEMREVVVPPAPDEELPELVRFQARNEFASLNDNWLLDFVPLSQDATVPRKVLAAGISPELNQQITRITEGAGLKLKHIVLRPLAVVDLLGSKLAEGVYKLVVIPNGNQIDMGIVAGRHPVLMRTVRAPATTDSEQRSQGLLGEIKRTLASSSQALGDNRVSEIIFFGDANNYKTLAGNLKNSLDLDLDFVQPFQLVPVSRRLSLPEDVNRYAGLMGSVAGQPPLTPKIDFLNPRRIVEKTIDRSRIYLYGGIALAATLLAVLFGWWTLRTQASEIATLKQDLADAIELNKGDGTKRPGVEQIMGEVSKIDRWKIADVNWLDELYQYSNRFLTPDDAIVDSFDAAVRRNEARIIVRSRVAGVQKEEALIDALDSRPYQVTPTKSGTSDQDASYPMTFDFNLVLPDNRAELIKELDEKTATFLQHRNAGSRPE
jgi:hypothetical protein